MSTASQSYRRTLDTRARAAEAVIAVDVGEETVLYHEDRDSLHLLDPIASVVWAELDGRTPVGEVCRLLSEAFGAELTVVQRDVVALVDRLGEAGVLCLEETDGNT